MPTRARRTVLALLCSMAFVLYLDRVCIGQAATAIQRDLGLSDTRMGFVFAAFTLAYGLFEIPAGRMGDRFGARRILIRIVVWWSLFTALTGASLGFLTLLATRFLFGAGEAGAYPNAARILARWFPARERGRAQALLVLGGLAGAAVAPAFASRLIEAIGWRWTFACFGAAGALWVLAFAARFRDDPARDPAVNALELQEIDAGSALGTEAVGPTPWRAALGHRTLWRLGGITVAVAFTLYFFYSWYPKYLQEACGTSSTDAGLWASAVLAASAAGNFLGGFGADWCLRRPSPLAWRRRLGAGSCALGASLLAASLAFESVPVSATTVGAACFCLSLQTPLWWGCATDVSGRHVGALFGLMNTMGVVGATCSQIFFGSFADWRAAHGAVGRAQWDPALLAAAGLLVAAAFFWTGVDPSRPIGPSATSPSAQPEHA